MHESISVIASTFGASIVRQLLSEVRHELAPASPASLTAECVVIVHAPPEIDALAELQRFFASDQAPGAWCVVWAPGADAAMRRALLEAGATELLTTADIDASSLGTAIDQARSRVRWMQGRTASPLPPKPNDSETRLKRIFETNLLGILYWRLDGTVLGANDEFLRIVGYDRADLEAGDIDWSRMTPPEHQEQDRLAVEELQQTGRHAPIEKEYFRKDGSRVWVLVGSAMTDELGGVGFVLDISRQKHTEEALRTSQLSALNAVAHLQEERARLDAILDTAPAGIVLADAKGRLVRFNVGNERLWGPAPLSETVQEYQVWKGWWADNSERHGRQVQPHEWAMARAIQGETVRGDVIEIEPFDQPGSRRTMLNSGAPVRDAQGHVIGGVIVQMDISALIQAQAAQRESEARFRALADNIAQLAWIAEPSGYIYWYNRRWLDYTGATLEDMQGWGWRSVHHPDHVERVTQKFKQHLSSGEPWEDTFPLRGQDGRYRWFLSRAFPLRDAEGRIVNWFGTNTDVTDQLLAEEALRDADRRKDDFIAILAHELRNPLAPVRNSVEILRRLSPSEPRLMRAAEIIDRQVTHMARLIDDLLDVSRITRGKLALQREPCDLATIVCQTAEDYRSALEMAGLRVNVAGCGNPMWVYGDPVRLAQMIGNLLNNAGRFTDKGGHVDISTEADEATGQAVVRVADSGVGIEPELLPKLFEPFSQADQDLARTKGGLGLGLALTRGLAELHGGHVQAHSEGAGRGTTFTLRLPLCQPAAQGRVVSAIGSSEGRRVLVVEDNIDAAETLSELLKLAGHDVRVALDGASAISLARSFRPEAIISDIGLPGEFDGYALARKFRSDPTLRHVRLIAVSGYANDDARRQSAQAGFDAHWAKPVDPKLLERQLMT